MGGVVLTRDHLFMPVKNQYDCRAVIFRQVKSMLLNTTTCRTAPAIETVYRCCCLCHQLDSTSSLPPPPFLTVVDLFFFFNFLVCTALIGYRTKKKNKINDTPMGNVPTRPVAPGGRIGTSNMGYRTRNGYKKNSLPGPVAPPALALPQGGHFSTALVG